jgi:hypothetical protein
MANLREYKVWIKGQHISTAALVLAYGVDNAKIKFANQVGKKSYEVDAMWTRRDVPKLGYSASR